MKNKYIADVIAIIHLAWVLCAVLSLPLVFFIEWWSRVALAFVIVTLFSWAVFRGCWFLQLEHRYRALHRPADVFEEEAFIQHYLKRFLNIHISRPTVSALIYIYMSTLLLVSAINAF